MSPVSRGRKKKTSNKHRRKAGTGPLPTLVGFGAPPSAQPARTVLDRFLGPPERPPWFDKAITRVMENAGSLAAAHGPRELEQHTAELVGSELHTALREEHKGLWFDWWLRELVDATADQIKKEAGDGDWMPAFWLLHGLAALASPGLRSQIPLDVARTWLDGNARDQLPDWLADTPRMQATSDVFRMCDGYGTRFAVIAGFQYPRTEDRSVYLFDIDASGFINLVGAGAFDDIEQATSAWRTAVGEAADQVLPARVTDANELLCLSHLDQDERAIGGNESRNVMDNWFRAQRRIHDIAAALRKRGMPLPSAASLYHDLDISVLTEPFTAWYTATHRTQPNQEAVDALAAEWMEGTLPETWFAVSPHRVRFQRALISDWVDDPITETVKAMMPQWVRWLAERASLPEHLAEQALATAGSRSTTTTGYP